MSLWAVTSYFSLGHGARRLTNFRRFRERLGARLLAVELSFDGVYDLAPSDADIVMRVGNGDVMWQKERLINLAVAYLPADCTAVAVIDCDVIFADAAWPQKALAALATAHVVQLFGTVHYLPKYWEPKAPFDKLDEGMQIAIPRGIAAGASPTACFSDMTQFDRGKYSAGMAWGYRRDLLARHGLFQFNVIGGGDTAVSAACFGAFDAVEQRHQMTPAHGAAYRAWAAPWFADVQGRVSNLDGDLFHMWHGDLAKRQAHTRHAKLAANDYDPAADVVAAPNQPLRWNSAKPALHETLARFFTEREG